MEWLPLAITLLLVMDPFGNGPILSSLLEKVEPARRSRIIFRECLIALGLLLLFLILGPRLMSLLSLEQPALNVAGGVVLMLIALRMLFPGRGGSNTWQEAQETEPFIVPIATPLVAGPSAIATVILIHGNSEHWFSTGLIALGIAWSITTVVMVLTMQLIRVIGKPMMIAAERLMGILLTVIAVQMVLDGLEQYIAAVQAGA